MTKLTNIRLPCTWGVKFGYPLKSAVSATIHWFSVKTVADKHVGLLVAYRHNHCWRTFRVFLRFLSDMPSRRRLRSSLTHQLDPPVAVRNSTVDDRAFAVAGARLWNSLPPGIVASNTLSQFRRQLKTFLSRQSYLFVLLSWLALLTVVLAVFTQANL